MPDYRTLIQNGLTALANSTRARRVVEFSPAAGEVINRYVAGQDDAALVPIAQQLTERNRRLTITRLVTPPTDAAGAEEAVDAYLRCVDALAAAGVGGRDEHETETEPVGASAVAAVATPQVRMRDPWDLREVIRSDPSDRGWVEISLTLLALGWGSVPEETIVEQLHRLVRGADARGVKVTIASEDTLGPGGPGDVLPLLPSLREIADDTGVALHASLRRTEADCRKLTTTGARVVLLKGHHADVEGFHRRRTAVDQSFVRCLRVLMEGDGYPVVTTNDPRLLRLTQALAEYVGRTPDTFEYQLRYGVRPETQAIIADRGDQLRIITPYGPDWYSYLVGRIAEQPENVVKIIRNGMGR